MKKIRRAIKKQLQYIRRDRAYIDAFLEDGVELTLKQEARLRVIGQVYEQQQYMCENNIHSVSNRIVSIRNPALEKIELLFVSYYELCFDIPITSLTSRANFYCMILFVLTVFIWCDKKYRLMIVLLPLWLSVVICILGPAIMRHPGYSLPIVYSIPFVFERYILE